MQQPFCYGSNICPVSRFRNLFRKTDVGTTEVQFSKKLQHHKEQCNTLLRFSVRLYESLPYMQPNFRFAISLFK